MIKKNSTFLFGKNYVFDIELPAFFYNDRFKENESFMIKSDSNISLPPQKDLSNFIGINEHQVVTGWKVKDGKLYIGRYIAPIYLENDFGKLDTNCDNFQKNCVASLISTLSIASVTHAFNRNAISLHGSSLAKNGKGIILLGDAGAGKSTLSSYLITNSEFKIISDDLTIIEQHSLRLYNGFQFIKLWPNEIPNFTQTKHFEKIVSHASKVVVPLDIEHRNQDPDIILNSIFILNRSDDFYESSYYLIEKKDLLITLLKFSYMKFIFSNEEKLRLSKMILNFINNFVNIYVINIPNDLKKLSEVSNLIESLSC